MNTSDSSTHIIYKLTEVLKYFEKDDELVASSGQLWLPTVITFGQF